MFHLAGATSLLLFVVFLPSRLIKVSSVECATQYGACPSDMQFSIFNFHREAGYSFSNLSKTKKEIAKILDNNLLISSYSTQYAFPDKIKVNILLKKPRFAIFDKTSSKYLLLGNDGIVLTEATETSLPTVIQEGGEPNLFALSLMEGIFAMYQVNRGEIVNNSLVVELPSGVGVIFPLEGDKDLLLGSLRLIYSKVDDKEIDLRFDAPVLR